MRAARFAAQLGFRLDNDLVDAMVEQAASLRNISWERRRDELEKIIVSPDPGNGIRLLVDTGLMEQVCPEVAAMKGVGQPEAYHRADVLEHTLLTMSYLEPEALLRRAALFHDVGKPPSRITEPRVMFPEHDKVGAGMAQRALRRLRYGNGDIQATVFLVRHHMRPIHYEREWRDATVRRLVRDCTLAKEGKILVGPDEVFALARADVEAGNLEKVPVFLGLIDDLEARIARLEAPGEIHLLGSPLNGLELMELFGREPGHWLKPVKEYLAHLVIEGELAHDDKKGAAARAREFMFRM